MAQEIGSCFWLDRFEQVGLGGEEISLSHLNIEIADAALLSTGRSAISYVLEHITNGDRRRVALLPPFTCYTVIEPFLRAGYQVIYYRIAEDLSLSTDSLREDIDKYHPSVLLVHGYFGFDTLRNAQDLLVDIRDAGTILVEDVTHTMYSEFAHVHADYYVGSFRKWAPLPDGGVAVSTKDKFSYKPMTSDNELQEAKLQAFHAKVRFLAFKEMVCSDQVDIQCRLRKKRERD